MPPRKRVSASANRVYKSSTPLKQAKLTAPKKRIRSYGKKSGVQLPKPDNTLTQMDWLKMQQVRDEEQQQQEDDDEDYEVEVEKPKRKRRKTTGDEPSATPQLHTQTISQVWSIKSAPNEEEQDMGEDPENGTKKRKSKRRKTVGDELSRTPQFHTQTLTQLDQSFNSAPEEKHHSIFDAPSSSQSAKPPKSVRKGPARKARDRVATPPQTQKSPARDMPPPQTPHRPMPREIPSSESPGTPVSLHSRGSTARRSPLNEISMTTPIPFNPNPNPNPQGSPIHLPKLEIQNSSESGTHSSQLSRIPTTPSKRSSPAKSVRFVLPDVEEEEGPAAPMIKLEPTSYKSQAPGVNSLRTEILDSDAESEEEIDLCRRLPASISQVEKEENTEQEAGEDTEWQETIVQGKENQPEGTESCYGEIGADTQFEAERIINSPRLSGITPATQAHGDPEPETFKERTQIMESQRLATQYMDNMAARTATSDIFITLPSQHVTNILSRAKDHDMRPYAFPPTVCRVWIYEAKPVCALKYMAEIGPAKRPGQISDERGLGNTDFNEKKGRTWNAYEILQLYELSDPLPLPKLIANEWLDEPPKKFAKVRPAVIDQLVANLKPPLFHTESDDPASSSTDTQEAEAQLLSTIKQFTQLVSSSQLPSQAPSSQFIRPEVESHESTSSIYATTSTNGKMGPPASQATTVDLSQTQTPRHQSVVEVVWESPTRPVPSSTPLKLRTPLSAGSQNHVLDSIVPYSMASSQLLTKSQLLPNSLLDESVPGPPLFIQDSDGEEEL
jgi:hypothetical protein